MNESSGTPGIEDTSRSSSLGRPPQADGQASSAASQLSSERAGPPFPPLKVVGILYPPDEPAPEWELEEEGPPDWPLSEGEGPIAGDQDFALAFGVDFWP